MTNICTLTMWNPPRLPLKVLHTFQGVCLLVQPQAVCTCQHSSDGMVFDNAPMAAIMITTNLEVVWVFLFIIMFATHEVGSAVAQILEHLQGTCQGLFGTTPLLHLGSRHLMSKLIL